MIKLNSTVAYTAMTAALYAVSLEEQAQLDIKRREEEDAFWESKIAQEERFA